MTASTIYQTSPSQIENASGEDGCWRRWWFKSVARVPEGKMTNAPLIGTAFHAARDRWIEGQDDPFPAGWDDEFQALAPVERVLVQQLIDGAIKAKTYRRVPGQEIEKSLDFEVLEAGDGLPAVFMKGRVDIWTIDGIEDDKTTHSAKYAKGIEKGPAALRTDIQLMSYGMAWLREVSARGDFAPPTVSLKHHYHLKAEANAGKPRSVTVAADPPVTPGDIIRFWDDVVLPSVREQRRLRVLATPRDDAHAEELWRTVPAAETERSKILNARSGPCAIFKGCPYREVCGGIRTVAEVRRINSGLPLERSLTAPVPPGNVPCPAGSANHISAKPQWGQGDIVAGSIFGGRMAASQAVGGLTAPGGTATAPPAPAPSPVVPPAAAAAPPPPAPPPVQTAQALAAIHAHAPPWAHPSCGACRDNQGEVTGVSSVGDPCKICTGRSKSEGKPHAEQFQHVLGKSPDSNPGHVFEWRVLPQFDAQVKAFSPVKTSGAIRVYHVTLTAPAAAPQAPAAAPAPPSPPPTGLLPPAVPAPAPAPAAAAAPPAPAPAASPPTNGGSAQPVAESAEATRQRRSSGFTLCIGSSPRGVPAVRLEVAWRTLCEKLAAEKGVPYYEIPVFDRRDMMASAVPHMIEAEKFGTKWIIAGRPQKSSDYAYFVEVVKSYAGTVVTPDDD